MKVEDGKFFAFIHSSLSDKLSVGLQNLFKKKEEVNNPMQVMEPIFKELQIQLQEYDTQMALELELIQKK
jgi:hypothetical protein